eukprot:2046870-Alexandrium_andersonii.AAC.1
MGPRAERMRWCTLYDGARAVTRWWHSMLVGLIGVFAAQGEDAWSVAEKAQPVPKPAPEKRDS